MIIVYLALAGATGAVLRLLADHYLPSRGILLANALGSLVAGLAAGLLSGPDSAVAREIWLTGVAGALTTFSTVSVSTARDALSGRFAAAAGSWAAHLAAGLLAVSLGLAVGAGWS
ncbi:fluoride efflux transporter FluC [Microbacterium sp. A93]|uniref:fluoride efflux transporter FluC n=1 Tax=Microbacterium sp. A93 TaxID=3450716 RepID=UPI003F422A63